jgi:hypothetical protein
VYILFENLGRRDKQTKMPELVDIIFLDIDGVLLPFGGKARDNDDDTTKNNNSDDNDGDGDCFVDGCLFPNRTMHAITTLLSRLTSSYVTHVTDNNITQQYAYCWNPRGRLHT